MIDGYGQDRGFAIDGYGQDRGFAMDGYGQDLGFTKDGYGQDHGWGHTVRKRRGAHFVQSDEHKIG